MSNNNSWFGISSSPSCQWFSLVANAGKHYHIQHLYSSKPFTSMAKWWTVMRLLGVKLCLLRMCIYYVYVNLDGQLSLVPFVVVCFWLICAVMLGLCGTYICNVGGIFAQVHMLMMWNVYQYSWLHCGLHWVHMKHIYRYSYLISTHELICIGNIYVTL